MTSGYYDYWGRKALEIASQREAFATIDHCKKDFSATSTLYSN